jgi:hypothetical protein
LHRDGDLPAIISLHGQQRWYKAGKCHRDGDLPAYIAANGTKYWYKDDKLHRDGDLPAIIKADGTEEYYKYGMQYTRASPAMVPNPVISENEPPTSPESLQSELSSIIRRTFRHR